MTNIQFKGKRRYQGVTTGYSVRIRRSKEGETGGALGEIRTHDLCLRRAALYPLSYKRAMGPVGPVSWLVPREGFEPTHP